MRYDSMLESYVLDSVASRHDMDSLAEKYWATDHPLRGRGRQGRQADRFDEVRVEDATRYAAEDADVTLRLHQTLWPKLRSVPALKKVFDEIEMPLVPVLLKIEHDGVLIDSEMLKVQSAEILQKCTALQQRARSWRRAVQRGFAKQLQAILFEKMGIPVIRRPPAASRPRPKTCWRNWPRNTSCRG